MNDQIKVKLCRKKEENNDLTQNELIAWLNETYNLKVSDNPLQEEPTHHLYIRTHKDS